MGSMLDIAGHLAFALIALSFLVRDILWLRPTSSPAEPASSERFSRRRCPPEIL